MTNILTAESLIDTDEEHGQSQFRSPIIQGRAWRKTPLALLAVAVLAAVAVMAAPQVPGLHVLLQHGPVWLEGKAEAEKSEERERAEEGEEVAEAATKKLGANESAQTPCKTAHADDEPSLFCWAVMFDDDKSLLTSQMEGRVGIFACNDQAVISPIEMDIGKDDCGNTLSTTVTDLPKVKKGMYGVDGSMTSSWLNVPIFLVCWDVVIESGKVWENDFTVKVDPDAVFFPGRLGYHMKEHKGKPVYTTDCRFWGGDPVGQLFGSIEVLSKEAVGTYKENKQTCKDLPWQGWGEDYWLQHCMDALPVPGVIIADWVTDGTCPEGGYADCGDDKFIALHPYKDAGAWWECWKQSNPE